MCPYVSISRPPFQRCDVVRLRLDGDDVVGGEFDLADVVFLYELLTASTYPFGLVRVEGHGGASQSCALDDAPPVTGLDRDDVYFALDLRRRERQHRP